MSYETTIDDEGFPCDSIGKLTLKRPRDKDAVAKLIKEEIEGHRYPPIRVLIEWNDKWKGKTEPTQ